MANYTGNSIVDYLGSLGQASDFGSRTNLAKKYNIANYTGTAQQNTDLLKAHMGSANPSGTSSLSSPITAASSKSSMTAHTTPMMSSIAQQPPKPMLSGATSLSSPAAQTFVNNQTSGGGYSSPAYNAQGAPNFSTSPAPQISTPAYGASGKPNFNITNSDPSSSSSSFPQISGDPNKVFSSLNGVNYNYAGEVIPNTGGGSGAGNISSANGNGGGADTVVGGGSGNGTGSGTNSGYTSPDRQAYIDAYKNYMDKQTNNTDVANAKTAYNDYVANMAKSVSGLEGKGTGVPLSIVRGTQEKALKQFQPEANRLQGAIDIAQGGQTNAISGAKSGVDLQSGLLNFGQQDFTNKNAIATQNRLDNPDFSLGEGQVHYTYDSKTGTYKKTSGPAKTYKPTSTSSVPSSNQVNQHVRQQMATAEFKQMSNDQKKDFILRNGGNPVDYNIF